MFRHPDSQLFYTDSVHKSWVINVVEDNFDITNEYIYKDEITITDNLCSDQEITLGACEAVELEFKMTNLGTSLKDKHLRVYMRISKGSGTPVPIGLFKVEEEELEEDQRVRSIKAYDALYEINNKDFAPWFNNLQFPMTLKDFRDSFFLYANVEQNIVDLPNDNIVKFNFVVTNSSATKRMLEEEQEKRNQLVEAAELGITTVKYTLINPDTYDDYPCIKDDTYDCHYPNGYTPVYLKVQSPPTAANPRRMGWFEKNGQGIPFRSVDTKLTAGHVYYTVEPAPTANPQLLGWYVFASGNYVPATATSIETDERFGYKTYYKKTSDALRSPHDLNWWVVQDGEYKQSRDDHIVFGRDYYERTEIDPPKPRYVEYTPDPDPSEPINPKKLGLYEYNSETGGYDKTDDPTIDPNKTYYMPMSVENDNTAYIKLNLDAHRIDNPKERGWYEKKTQGEGVVFFLTDDTTIDRTKEYYFNIYDELLHVDKDIVEDQILGSEIIKAICEINGCFGHIDRYGFFTYIFLKPIDYEDLGLYPASDLYPDPNLYPAGAPADQDITRAYYEDITRSDYLVSKLDRLVICKEDGDAGYIYPPDSLPDNHNTYKITGNFIWYGFTDTQSILDVVGMNIVVYGIAQISEYTPCSIDMMGNPCIDVGDTIKIHTRTGDICTYVMKRTLTGSQRLKDSIEATGSKKRDTGENNLYDAVIELKGKSNILTRTVDETRSEIIDASEGLSSLIAQTADSIMLSVSREIKNVEDGTKTIYEASTKYTDFMIQDTVSKKEYDDNNEIISQNFSIFERTADHIEATVESKLDAEGTGEGFQWELLTRGMIWRSKGGYADITDQLTDDMDLQHLAYTVYDMNENRIIVPTEDDHKKPNKSYYRDFGAADDYQDVMSITRSGLWLRDMLTTEMLDVRNTATITNLNVTKDAIIEQLEATTAQIESLYATKAEVGTLVAESIRTATINANQIVGGTVKATQVDTNTLTANVITSLGAYDYNKGTIQIGKMKPGKLYFNNHDAIIPDGAYARAFLQVVPRKVRGTNNQDYWCLVVSTAQ